MITSWEELGDVLAEFENRLLFLENSQPYELPEAKEKTRRPFIPRPVVNVTYQMGAKSTPAFKELEEKIALINGRLTKYFEYPDKKKKVYKQYS